MGELCPLEEHSPLREHNCRESLVDGAIGRLVGTPESYLAGKEQNDSLSFPQGMGKAEKNSLEQKKAGVIMTRYPVVYRSMTKDIVTLKAYCPHSNLTS